MLDAGVSVYKYNMDVLHENLPLWKVFSNLVYMYHCIVIFPYLLKSWNHVHVIATGYPVPKMGNVANH